MGEMLPEDRAWRRSGIALLLGMLIGFLASALAGAYLVVRFVLVPEGWWSAAMPLLMWVTFVPFLVGGFTGIAASKAVVRWHYWRGYFRCFRCGQRLRSGSTPCPCRLDELGSPGYLPRRQRPKWRSALRHYRRHFPRFVVAFLMLLAVATAGPFLLRRTSRPVTVFDIFAGHVLMSYLLVLGGELLMPILQYVGLSKRTRLRAVILVQLFFLWSLAGLIYLGIAT